MFWSLYLGLIVFISANKGCALSSTRDMLRLSSFYRIIFQHKLVCSLSIELNVAKCVMLSGLVFFTIRWWDPVYYEAMHSEGAASRASSPYVENKQYLWTWLFFIPLVVYIVWQLLYFLFVDVLRRQRLLRDPEVMTSYRFSISLAFSLYVFVYEVSHNDELKLISIQ